jgi:hypothetical protein
MSEVHRYKAVKMQTGVGNNISYTPHGPEIVLAEHFDRVTAERDAALESIGRLNDKLSCMSAHVLAYKLSRQRLLGRARVRELLVSELQQRLTAADERADVLEVLLGNAYEAAARWVEKRCDAYVDEHGSSDPETGTVEFPGDGEEYVGELMEIADGLRALKPAKGGGNGGI